MKRSMGLSKLIRAGKSWVDPLKKSLPTSLFQREGKFPSLEKRGEGRFSGPFLPSLNYCTAVLFFLISALSYAAEGPQVLTLENALSIASERNRDILRAREYKRWVEGKYVEERSAALPQFSMTGSIGLQRDMLMDLAAGEAVDVTSKTAQISVSQPLFTWGKVGAAIRAAKEGLLSADEQLRLMRQAVFKDVVSAFSDVLLARELENISTQDHDQKERRRQEAERRYAAGTATDYDLLVASVSVENVRPEVIRSANRTRSALDRLRFLLATEVPIEVSGNLEPVLTDPPSYEEALAVALRQRPEVNDIRHRLSIAGNLVKIADADDKPRLDFKGSYGRTWLNGGGMSVESPSWNAGLYLTFPFFDGLKTSGRKAEAESDRRSLEIEEAKLKDSIALEVRSALHAVEEAKEIIRAVSGTVGQAERLLFITEKGLELGVKIRLDVEDAELKLNQARANRAKAWRDYRVARASLLRAEGLLGEEGY